MSLTPTSAKDLRELATVSPADIDRAREEWKSVAPSELKDILDAVEHSS